MELTNNETENRGGGEKSSMRNRETERQRERC